MLCAQFHHDVARSDDDPGPRCGHTLTCVPADGGGQRLIVFGGATALEGDGFEFITGIKHVDQIQTNLDDGLTPKLKAEIAAIAAQAPPHPRAPRSRAPPMATPTAAPLRDLRVRSRVIAQRATRRDAPRRMRPQDHQQQHLEHAYCERQAHARPADPTARRSSSPRGCGGCGLHRLSCRCWRRR